MIGVVFYGFRSVWWMELDEARARVTIRHRDVANGRESERTVPWCSCGGKGHPSHPRMEITEEDLVPLEALIDQMNAKLFELTLN